VGKCPAHVPPAHSLGFTSLPRPLFVRDANTGPDHELAYLTACHNGVPGRRFAAGTGKLFCTPSSAAWTLGPTVKQMAAPEQAINRHSNGRAMLQIVGYGQLGPRTRALHPQVLPESLRRADHPEIGAEHHPGRRATWQHHPPRPALSVNSCGDARSLDGLQKQLDSPLMGPVAAA
jgi:hypothetical protein